MSDLPYLPGSSAHTLEHYHVLLPLHRLCLQNIKSIWNFTQFMTNWVRHWTYRVIWVTDERYQYTSFHGGSYILAFQSAQSVMIAEWENECISLSVLTVARVMIAQWDNERLSLSVLPVAWVQFPTMAEYFKGLLPGWSHVLLCTPFREYQRAKWCLLYAFNLMKIVRCLQTNMVYGKQTKISSMRYMMHTLHREDNSTWFTI